MGGAGKFLVSLCLIKVNLIDYLGQSAEREIQLLKRHTLRDLS